MPSANEAELARVYTTNAGGGVAEEAVRFNQAFRVVAEAEAGQTLFNGGGPYKLILVLRDLSDNPNSVANSQIQAGLLGTAPWVTPQLRFQFNVPAQGPTKKDHLYQASVLMTIGNNDPIVDAEESELLVITE
jgi:hypothetical protein